MKRRKRGNKQKNSKKISRRQSHNALRIKIARILALSWLVMKEESQENQTIAGRGAVLFEEQTTREI